MEKDSIFDQRKELKKKSHMVVKGHYIVLVFLMLVLILFGLEFSNSMLGVDLYNQFFGQSGKNEGQVNILSADDVISSSDVLSFIENGKLSEGIRGADRLSKLMKETRKDSKAFGMSRGVLAQIVNAFGSGKLFSGLAQTIRTITKSDQAVAVIFTLGSFLLYAFVFIFIKNVYSAAMRRVYLEARVYRLVSFLDSMFFAGVKKWVRASWSMLVMYVYLSLWHLTIVGGVIKSYSYWAVPYIIAENPSVGGKEAVTLSRRMMYGHKLELLKYQITLLGWTILGIITFGASDILYGAPYRMACYTEFYSKVREQAKEKGIEGIEVLNDRYLFERADRILLYETYFDVVDEITILHENKIELKGWRKKIADWFGIWAGTTREKKAYDDQEGRTFAIKRLKMSMEGSTYPLWLNLLWRKKGLEKRGDFTYLRNYTVWTLFLLFVAFCFVGWFWEVALHFMQTGQFANRGTLHGPWLPIYGTGGIVVLLLCSRFRKNPVLEFFTAILLCGILEYFSGWYLEMKYHQRWWSYDGYFLNLHGRICAEGLLVFGVGCCLVVYVVAPIFDYLLSKIRARILIAISLVLAVIYAADVIYSSKHPNMAKGAVEVVHPEEAVTEAVTETLPAET